MKPVVGVRAGVQADLYDISQTLMAWRAIFLNRGTAPLPRFIAYVLGGSYRNATTAAREVLAEARAEVVDVNMPAERDGLLPGVL